MSAELRSTPAAAFRLALLTATLLACESAPEVRLDEEDEEDEVATTVSAGSGEAGVEASSDTLAQASDASIDIPAPAPPRVLEIGVLDGSPEETFGRIGGVATDDAGNIYVLDEMAAEIRVFGSDGAFKAVAGGAGSGPGEFRSPRGLAVDTGGLVHTSDPWRAKLSTSRLSGDSLVHVRDTRLALPLHRLCAHEGRLIALAPRADYVLHEIGGDGEILNSFASPIHAPDDEPLPEEWQRGASRTFYNVGELYCGSPGIVVLVHASLPDVRAFGLDGRELWRATLDDFHGMHQKKGPGSTVQTVPRRSDGLWNVGAGAARLGPDTLAVTVATRGAGEPSYRLRLLSLTTGKALGEAPAAAAIAAVRDGQAYGYREEPFPQVVRLGTVGMPRRK